MPKLRLSRDKNAERMRLLKQGMGDVEIAKACGVSPSVIQSWRKRRGLPSAMATAKREGGRCDVKRWKLPVDPSAIRPSHMPELPPERHSLRALLYALGWDDSMIGREVGVTRASILQWRIRRGLPAHHGRGGKRVVRAPRMADLLAECRRAVGRYLPRDIADDAVADLMMAVMTGKAPVDQIDTLARQYGSRVIGEYASKWGARSLDEELGGEEGFTLLDTLRDDSSASWLEEMGATAW